jgi:ribosomal protein S12 methylthiotransferase
MTKQMQRENLSINATKPIALVNLGCSKNQVDGETILQAFSDAGFPVVADPAEAAVIIVNTCAFITEAKQEAIDTILEMARFKKSGRCAVLAVAGCFSQRYRRTAARELPEVDVWLSIDNLAEDLRRHFSMATDPASGRYRLDRSATAYLKISEGCSHRCSFCAIPLIRGPFRSRLENDIIAEAKRLESQGVKECIVVSQDTSFYGRDRKNSLSRLLERLLHETNFPWIRMMYLHPRYIENDLLDLVAAEKRLCPYFDVPLQHCSDSILKSMNRTPLKRGIVETIDRIRSRVPGAAIRTAFIAGYPGETEEHFNELARFVEEMRFDKLGVFPFSPEEGTAAFSLRSRPRTATVMRRCEALMEIQRHISRELLAAKVGGSMPVIVDEIAERAGANFAARTRADAPEVDGTVYIRDGDFTPGSITEVRIVDSDDYDLFAGPA